MTTRSQLNSDVLGADAATRTPDPPIVDERATTARRGKTPAVPHRNEIDVVGELTSPVEPRRRTDGVEVLTFRVAVRTPTAGIGGEQAPNRSREDNPVSRRDILDCVASTSAVRRRLETYRPGDVVELAGSLRHRFWNSGGRVQSRYEIEVSTLKRLTRAPRSPGPERT